MVQAAAATGSSFMTDGRGRLAFRSFSLQPGIITCAHGSSTVRHGGTSVIAAVHGELEPLMAQTTDLTSVDRSLIKSISVEVKPANGLNGPELLEELQHVQRSIQSLIGDVRIVGDFGKEEDITNLGHDQDVEVSTDVATKTRDQYQWVLFVDILVIDFDVNLLDPALLSAVSAIMNTKLPSFSIVNREPEFSADNSAKLSIPSIPLSALFCTIVQQQKGTESDEKSVLISDPTADELTNSLGTAMIITNNGNFCGLNILGGAISDIYMINEAAAAAEQHSNELIKMLTNDDEEIAESDR